MNSWFLSLVIDSYKEILSGKEVASCRFLDPILAIGLRSSPGGTGRKNKQKQETAGGEHFVALVLSRCPFFFVTARDPLENCPAENVLARALGCSITSISQHEADRIVTIQLAKRGRAKVLLRVFLYGRNGRVILESGGEVIDGINARQGMRVDRGKTHLKRESFAGISRSQLSSALEKSIFVPGLDESLIEFFTGKDSRVDVERILEFRDAVSLAKTPFFMVHGDNPTRAFPFPSMGAKDLAAGSRGPFANPASAASAIGEALLNNVLGAIIEREARPFKKRLQARQRLLEKLKNEMATAAMHESMRRETEILAAFQSQIRSGASRVELPDLYHDDSTVIISLDPRLPVPQQIQRRFKRAAKMKRSLGFIGSRIDSVKKEISALEAVLDAITATKDAGAALSLARQARKEHGIPSAGIAVAKKEGEKRFRKFDLDHLWFILVGRSNRENDELTFHSAAPSDYWLHAQSVPGSHVILKSRGTKENPPRKILEMAASIAAYYSQSRHSSVVSVIYTRKKYVRKPRKAEAGKVVCTHEKTIFVQPGIPEAKTPNSEPQ